MKAAIYTRTATEHPEAMGYQADRCQAYARDRGWRVIGTWTDIGSGLDADRPGLAALRAAAAAGAVDVIVATSPDRLARDTALMRRALSGARLGGAVVAVAEEAPAGRTLQDMIEQLGVDAQVLS